LRSDTSCSGLKEQVKRLKLNLSSEHCILRSGPTRFLKGRSFVTAQAAATLSVLGDFLTLLNQNERHAHNQVQFSNSAPLESHCRVLSHKKRLDSTWPEFENRISWILVNTEFGCKST
jgi:hypothetical protein